jgi:hypothetical protein
MHLSTVLWLVLVSSGGIGIGCVVFLSILKSEGSSSCSSALACFFLSLFLSSYTFIYGVARNTRVTISPSLAFHPLSLQSSLLLSLSQPNNPHNTSFLKVSTPSTTNHPLISKSFKKTFLSSPTYPSFLLSRTIFVLQLQV